MQSNKFDLSCELTNLEIATIYGGLDYFKPHNIFCQL
jgi:hypothetical protein